MTDRRSEVAAYLLALEDASKSYMDFVRLIQPDWKFPYFQVELIEALDALEKNTLGCNNMLVTMPPRRAKSTFSTVMFPPYYMARDPRRNVMSASYNSTLAEGFGREVRAIVERPQVGQAFPDLSLSPKYTAADNWKTQHGGRYFAVGLDGTTSGRPANLLIVDDPVKSRDDAESPTKREKVWNFYASALKMRLEPDAAGNPPKQIVILTRWHPDDLAGRLMKSEDWEEGLWHHVNFPALIKRRSGILMPRAQLPETDPLKVPADDPDATEQVQTIEEVSSWPSRFPTDDLLRTRRMNPREFASLMQQEPYIEGGNLIKNEWWQRYPSDEFKPDSYVSIIIAVDTAFKSKEENDYSVMLVAGIDRHGNIHLIQLIRAKLEFPELKQRLIQLNTFWRGRGLRAIYIEDKASGQSLIQELKRQSGLAVIPHKVVHDKVARANSVLPLIEGGRVYIPDPSEAPWVDAFITECETFPGSTHDDQVDALVIALDVLSRTALSAEEAELSLMPHTSLNALGGDSFGPSLNQSNSAQKSLNSMYGKSASKLKPSWKGWGL